jgi:hypothetical protein
MPKLLPGYPVKYLTQVSRAIPPFDPTLTVVPWQGAAPTYFWNTSYLPGQPSWYYIGDTSESVVDERINPFSPTSAANILAPNDYGMALSMRAIALSFVDRLYYFRDERQQQQVVLSYGPDRLGGTYPDMAPCNPTLAFNGIGSPRLNGILTDPANWPGYGGSLGDAGSVEPSHTPNPFYWPYIHSGHPMFLDAMMELCVVQATTIGGTQARSAKFNGKNYTWAFSTGGQARGMGHQLKTTWQTEWMIPDSHTAKAYFSDRMDDTSEQLLPFLKTVMSPLAQQHGWMPSLFPTFSNLQSQEPWMNGYFTRNLGQVAWIGTRPGFANLLEYLAAGWLRLFDSDQGGTEKALDAQFILVGTGLASTAVSVGAYFEPADNEWISDPRTEFASALNNAPYLGVYPPPLNFFLRGLLTAGNSNPGHTPGYAYWTTPISSNAYVVSNRDALIFCKLAGLTDYAKVHDRVEALMATTGVPIAFNATPAQVPTGNRNGFMYATKAF